MSTYILNYFRGHRFLSDALNSTISMSLKFRHEIDSTTFDNLIMEENENVVYELSCLASNLKKQSCSSFDFFSFFSLKKIKILTPWLVLNSPNIYIYILENQSDSHNTLM